MKKNMLLILALLMLNLFSCGEEKPTEPSNNAPIVKSISANPLSIKINEITNISCIATDEDGDALTYIWFSNFGSFPNGNSGSSINWKAPIIDSTLIITVTVSDAKEVIKDSISITVSSNNSISGIVFKANTTIPISNALIEIGDMTTVSDDNGAYKIEDIPSGQKIIKVSKTNYEVYEFPIIISSDKRTEHNVHLIGSIQLSGKVIDSATNKALSGVRITINDKIDSTDIDGNYKLTNLTPGTCIIIVIGDIGWYIPHEAEITLINPNTIYNIALKSTRCPNIPTVTYAGKTYNTIQIANQCWLKENLNVGTMIQSSSSDFQQTDNNIIEKYCYNNDEANCDSYGGLYEGTEAMQYVTTEGTQGICPTSWHIPTKEEWETLETYVNDKAVKLIDKSQSMSSSNTPTNETGFSALFAGSRDRNDGSFYNLGEGVVFWSSTVGNSGGAYGATLYDFSEFVHLNYGSQSFGFSIRCVKD
jgi:uncharacterized protein (TIGR02145 family)